MKLLAFAIASIVDAHLNQGHIQKVTGFSPDKVSVHIDHGRSIRSRLVHNLFHGVVQAIHTLIEKLKSEHQRRKNIAQLTGLNEHLLNDIGLNLNDIESLKSGAISIETLNAQRRPNATTGLRLNSVKSVSDTADLQDLECANEDSFGLSKCA